MFSQPEPNLKLYKRIQYFFAVHWKGVVTLVTPLVFLGIVLPEPAEPHEWVGYTLLVMAIYWVTECIPLAVTSFLPIILFPLGRVSTPGTVCLSYMNDTILMFLGSLFLAYSIEQSGLHKRLAYFAIRKIGYSHVKLLLAICCVTTFVSMWITNTAATTMMVPINFAILRVFENQGLIKMYETNADGEKVASSVTTCYFCAAAYSATIGGIGTLVGTGTNIAFKGLFALEFPDVPEQITFPLFMGLGVPLMICLSAFTYIYLAMIFFGLFMPRSKTAKKAKISEKGIKAAKRVIEDEYKKLGDFSFAEMLVTLCFAGAMISFFCRSPQIFHGWGDSINKIFEKDDPRYVRDSALVACVTVGMLVLPYSLDFFRNFTAEYHQDLPKGKTKSLLDWKKLTLEMPWHYMFLLGGGFALSDAAASSGLNVHISDALQPLSNLPNLVTLLILIIVVIFFTNFASNIAVANVMVPLSMTIARRVNQNPLWYCLAAGYSSSFCFMLPVGTPPNLIIQSAANIPTLKMIKVGSGITLATIIITWILMAFLAPVVFDVRPDAPWYKPPEPAEPEPGEL